jgi:phosphoribosylaminoimidazolecarboxamide formyltransferase/IMP cyclohydrolase
MKRWALISVYDKSGIEDFANSLITLDFEIFASKGTMNYLSGKGIESKSIEDLTGFKEIFDGRVKTLHPKIFASILARDNKDDLKILSELNQQPFEVVCVNLYPFMDNVKIGETGFTNALEEIDIGGVALLRASAKAVQRCITVFDPDDYGLVIDSLKGESDIEKTRLLLAGKVFAYTSLYDSHIARFFESMIERDRKIPNYSIQSFKKEDDLRYGENPHQCAGLYFNLGRKRSGIIVGGEKLSGKEMSFNNVVDLESAYLLVNEFTEPACAYIKHTNPCGCATGDNIYEVINNARNGDPVSSFGAIVTINRKVDADIAKEIVGPKGYLEAIIAPDYTDNAIDVFRGRAGWGDRFIVFKAGEIESEPLYFKDIDGGVLISERDIKSDVVENLNVVTRKGPSDRHLRDLLFAYKIVKYIKSNAIVIVRNGMMIGMGAGQPNRLTSVKLAIEQAEEFHNGCYSSVLASDAFFPMSDAPEFAVKSGVEAIIQPGGSKKDNEVIRVMNDYGIAMVFSGIRHFLH